MKQSSKRDITRDNLYKTEQELTEEGCHMNWKQVLKDILYTVLFVGALGLVTAEFIRIVFN